MKINKKLSIAALALFMSVASYAPVNAQDVSVDAVVASARMAAGVWEHSNGEWSYVVNGVEQTGWIVDGGAWYYLNDNGVMATGWALVDGTWYYLNANGSMATGWTVVNGNWYYLNNSGEMQTGWTVVDGSWYYLDANGAMATTGWLELDGTWYYLNANGSMAKGWVLDNGDWFYLNANGSMATEWALVDGTWYYLDLAGRMLTDITIGDWVIGADGVAKEVVKSNQTLLAEAIAAAEELVKADYIKVDADGVEDKKDAKAWADFQAELKAAKAVAKDEKATDAQRNVAREKLEIAKDKLVAVKVTKVALLAEIEANKDMRTDKAGEINYGKEFEEAYYTPETWKVYADALAHAEEVYANKNVLQSEVNAAEKDLAKAKKDLESIKSGKEGLREAIADAKKLAGPAEDATDYTVASWHEFQISINKADLILEDRKSDEADFNKAIRDLKEAESKLVVDPAAKSLLVAAIEEYEVHEAEDHVHTLATETPFKEALAEARALEADKNAKKTQVVKAIAKLKATVSGGTITVDKEEITYVGLVEVKDLVDAITDAKEKEKLGKEAYTANTDWTAFDNALAAAELAISETKKDAEGEPLIETQVDMDIYKDNLVGATKALVNIVELKKAVDTYKDLDDAKYDTTDTTWVTFEAKLAAAEAGLTSAANQTAADQLLADLNTAFSKLKKAETPEETLARLKSDLKTKVLDVAETEKLNEKNSVFTENSFEEFKVALGLAKTAYESDDVALVTAALESTNVALAKGDNLVSTAALYSEIMDAKGKISDYENPTAGAETILKAAIVVAEASLINGTTEDIGEDISTAGTVRFVLAQAITDSGL